MPFAGMWQRLRAVQIYFKALFHWHDAFFYTKITAVVPARVFRLSFASRLKLEQQWNIGFICFIKQEYPFIQNSHFLLTHFPFFFVNRSWMLIT